MQNQLLFVFSSVITFLAFVSPVFAEPKDLYQCPFGCGKQTVNCRPGCTCGCQSDAGDECAEAKQYLREHTQRSAGSIDKMSCVVAKELARDAGWVSEEAKKRLAEEKAKKEAEEARRKEEAAERLRKAEEEAARRKAEAARQKAEQDARMMAIKVKNEKIATEAKASFGASREQNKTAGQAAAQVKEGADLQKKEAAGKLRAELSQQIATIERKIAIVNRDRPWHARSLDQLQSMLREHIGGNDETTSRNIEYNERWLNDVDAQTRELEAEQSLLSNKLRAVRDDGDYRSPEDIASEQKAVAASEEATRRSDVLRAVLPAGSSESPNNLRGDSKPTNTEQSGGAATDSQIPHRADKPPAPENLSSPDKKEPIDLRDKLWSNDQRQKIEIITDGWNFDGKPKPSASLDDQLKNAPAAGPTPTIGAQLDRLGGIAFGDMKDAIGPVFDAAGIRENLRGRESLTSLCDQRLPTLMALST